MKCILPILLLSFCANAQDNRYAEWQGQWFKKASVYLKAGELDAALHFFASAEDILPESKLGKQALFKYDSLLPIARRKLLDDIKGEWKLIKYGTNWGYHLADESMSETISISANYITFNECNGDERRIVKKENLQYYTSPNEKDYGLSFILSGRTVWHIKIVKSTLSMIYLGDVNNRGSYNEVVCGNDEMYFERITNN